MFAVQPPAAEVYVAEHPAVQTILSYIKTHWATLTRTWVTSVADPKMASGKCILYLPRGVNREAFCAKLTDEISEKVIVRSLPENPEKIVDHGLLFLPNRYVVPGGRFNEMYGWDSYFIMLGLLADNEYELAKDMTDNFLYEIHHYGKILNANRTYYLSRSQPPFLTRMVLAIYKNAQKHGWGEPGNTGWNQWLRMAFSLAEKYYGYWTDDNHLTETGLSRYFATGKGPAPEVLASEKDEQGLDHYERVRRRFLRGDEPGYPLDLYFNMSTETFKEDFFVGDRAMRESGFDPSYRYGINSVDIIRHNPVCLNALLYQMELDMIEISNLIGLDHTSWRRRAAERRCHFNLLWDEKDGYFKDFNFVEGQGARYLFATTFYPLWAGIATKEQARTMIDRVLPLLEQKGGLMTSNYGVDEGWFSGCQWDAPNGWAPLQIMAVDGLRRYGYHEEANRLTIKFLSNVLLKFGRDGVIVEKYNVINPQANLNRALPIPSGEQLGYLENVIGFGWTNAAVTYLYQQLPQEERRKISPDLFDNLNFGLSSSNSEEFTSQVLGFFSKAIAEGAIAEKKSTRDASKVPEGEGEKPEVQVDRHATAARN